MDDFSFELSQRPHIRLRHELEALGLRRRLPFELIGGTVWTELASVEPTCFHLQVEETFMTNKVNTYTKLKIPISLVVYREDVKGWRPLPARLFFQ